MSISRDQYHMLGKLRIKDQGRGTKSHLLMSKARGFLKTFCMYLLVHTLKKQNHFEAPFIPLLLKRKY